MASYDGPFPLLTFIHKLYTDATFQQAFRQDPERAMDDYRLTWEQKIAIYHSGADPMFLTSSPVPNYPQFVDGAKLPPNPLSADWWAAYARYKADFEAGRNPAPVPNPIVNDRPEGDRVSLAGVMLLLGEELARKPGWDGPW